MSEKRRDNKNRILQTGEGQRKDGRYFFKYIDNCGKPQFIYSWKLTSADTVPKGKRDDISLREKEKQIERDIEDGIDTSGRKMTVLQLYMKFINTHSNVKEGSIEGRKRLIKRLND
ncbi:MAG: integrase DNA-binding domain-containing protein, partial [Lachnospiraceae bacterium]|nr:integrase DNA-binding domain-containing protein [Lachnospiraceae bacterium]